MRGYTGNMSKGRKELWEKARDALAGTLFYGFAALFAIGVVFAAIHDYDRHFPNPKIPSIPSVCVDHDWHSHGRFGLHRFAPAPDSPGLMVESWA